MFLLWGVFRWFRRTVYVLLAAAVAYLVVTSVQVVSASRVPGAVTAVQPASAIVVVGTAAGRSGLSPDVRARCGQAAALYRARRAAHVVATGGRPATGDPVEAAVLGSCLAKEGVPRRALSELPVADVPGQFQAVAQLYPKSGGATVIVVADPLETKWLLALASASGLAAVVSPAPAPREGFLSTVDAIWKQALAVGVGRIAGYSHTGWVSG